MKMVEVKLRSTAKELEKLTARKERAEKALAKATEKANRLNADMSKAEYIAWIETVETTENGFIANKADIERNGAYFDLCIARRNLEEVNEAIEKAERRFQKAEQAVDEYREEVNKLEDLKRKEELLKLEFEQEQKEWAKDGITLKGRYYGETPNGKRFVIERNNGWTERSLHCYSLWIGDMESGNTIFTSGEFWRAYAVVKKS